MGNQNPRSNFADGPSGWVSSQHDAGAGAAGPDRVIASPTPTGKKPREIAKASARAIVTGPMEVYFGDAEDDALYALSKSGGDPKRMARRAPMPNALSIEEERSLAWVASPGDTILRLSVKGGNPTTVREDGLFTDVATSNGELFFTEVKSATGFITKITGGKATRLGTFDGSPRGIALDDTHAYVASTTRLSRTARSSSSASEMQSLASGAGFSSPQVDETALYAIAVNPKGAGRIIVRVKKTGGGEVTTVAANVRDAAIALHKNTLYWFDADRPALLSVSTSGAARTVTVSEDALLDRPSALAVDDDGAYVATGYGESARIVLIPSK